MSLGYLPTATRCTLVGGGGGGGDFIKKIGWGWLDKFKNQFSFTSELKITDSELKSTTIIKNINTTNVSPEIKSKLINLNIPMQSFYYAMSIVKSTANKDNNKLLKLYYDNRDLFMENYKKREAEKMSPKK